MATAWRKADLTSVGQPPGSGIADAESSGGAIHAESDRRGKQSTGRWAQPSETLSIALWRPRAPGSLVGQEPLSDTSHGPSSSVENLDRCDRTRVLGGDRGDQVSPCSRRHGQCHARGSRTARERRQPSDGVPTTTDRLESSGERVFADHGVARTAQTNRNAKYRTTGRFWHHEKSPMISGRTGFRGARE
jgi:hypothetical protein